MAADQREPVFARIRAALRTPAPHRLHGHVDYTVTTAPDSPSSTPDARRAWLPLVGPRIEDQIALFAQNAALLKADFRSVDSLDEAARQFRQLSLEEGWQSLATHANPLTLALSEKLELPRVLVSAEIRGNELEPCSAGLTSCDALVAQTGSVLVSTASAGGRALSVLPPHHVVIAQRRQMVPDLTAALEVVRQRYAPNWPSLLSFITGPSRTGDIERILVLGAHGPKKLTIFLVP